MRGPRPTAYAQPGERHDVTARDRPSNQRNESPRFFHGGAMFVN